MDELAHDPNHDASANNVLAALPPAEIARVSEYLEPLSLPAKFDLYRFNEPIEHVYFVYKGVASIMTPMKDGPPVEIATIGPEGFIGVPVLLGADRNPSHAFMQVPGHGSRMATAEFIRAVAENSTFRRVLLRYTTAMMSQMSQNAACTRTHSVEERCARWLLMTQDRVKEPTFPLRQDFIAQMLGVRRPTVSIAAGMLARAGFISYVRGVVTIRDRAGLESASCECYRIITEEFDSLGSAYGELKSAAAARVPPPRS